MNNIIKVSKFQVYDTIKAWIIYYSIIILVALGMVILNNSGLAEGEIKFSGFGVSAVIFLFVNGLNWFKANFKFFLANNISRKRFFYASVLAIIAVSAFMAVVDVIFDNVLELIIPYESLFEQLYKNNPFPAELLWICALLIFAVSLGWLITILYYKCSKLMKTVISFVPVFVIVLLMYINNFTHGAFIRWTIKFFTVVLGFSGGYHPYTAVLSFLIGAAGVLALSYLLMRKMPIKD